MKLFGDRDGLYKGVEYFADLPYFLGTRGHAQMVPFGMGSIPVSLLVHHKTGYFARDLGHPEWAVDPRQDGFADRLYAVLHEVDERRTELRTELAEVRERFYRVTLDNLAAIYARLTGESVAPVHTPYTPFERRLAERAYAESLSRSVADEKVRELTAELESARNADEVPKVAEWLLARARGAADQGDLARARALLRGLDAAAPEFFNGKHRRPRWDEGAYRLRPGPGAAGAAVPGCLAGADARLHPAVQALPCRAVRAALRIRRAILRRNAAVGVSAIDPIAPAWSRSERVSSRSSQSSRNSSQRRSSSS